MFLDEPSVTIIFYYSVVKIKTQLCFFINQIEGLKLKFMDGMKHSYWRFDFSFPFVIVLKLNNSILFAFSG